jgi:predicted nucleic acid-binding protein
MIVLYTDVLSEPLRPRPHPGVLAWLTGHDDEVFVTAISVGELLAGVRALPEGRRRTGLLDAVGTTLSIFADSILPYDEGAARRFAGLGLEVADPWG